MKYSNTSTMSIELSKKEKKIARELIEKGLQAEFRQCLESIDLILQRWKDKETNGEDSYRSLYKTVKDFDKHIVGRYDRLSGSMYVFVLAGLLHDKLISEDDLNEMEEAVRNGVLFVAREIGTSP